MATNMRGAAVGRDGTVEASATAPIGIDATPPPAGTAATVLAEDTDVPRREADAEALFVIDLTCLLMIPPLRVPCAGLDPRRAGLHLASVSLSRWSGIRK
jgi:hypothetical protein